MGAVSGVVALSGVVAAVSGVALSGVAVSSGAAAAFLAARFAGPDFLAARLAAFLPGNVAVEPGGVLGRGGGGCRLLQGGRLVDQLVDRDLVEDVGGGR